jgi:hypothetical protein
VGNTSGQRDMPEQLLRLLSLQPKGSNLPPQPNILNS